MEAVFVKNTIWHLISFDRLWTHSYLLSEAPPIKDAVAMVRNEYQTKCWTQSDTWWLICALKWIVAHFPFSFIDLKEVNFGCTGLSEESIHYLTKNLSPNLEKINLSTLTSLRDEHVKALVTRCHKLSSLNLSDNVISNSSLTNIIESRFDMISDKSI